MKFTAVLLALATAAMAAPTVDLDTRGNDRNSCNDYGNNHGNNHGKNYGNNYDNYGNHDNDHGRKGHGHGNVDKYRQRHGRGRHHGKQELCDNWVPVDKNLVVLDVDVDICINLNVPGLLNIKLDLDVEIDVDLLSQNYPTYKSLYCCPDKQCKKGQKVRKEKCWEHEFDNKYKHGKGGKY